LAFQHRPDFKVFSGFHLYLFLLLKIAKAFYTLQYEKIRIIPPRAALRPDKSGQALHGVN
jgi:hypothetical protein